MKTFIFHDKYISGLELHIEAPDRKKAEEYLSYRIDEANDLGYTLPHISQWELA